MQMMIDGSGFLLPLLFLAGFFTGFVDSMVGGGGMIQLPVLFQAFPFVQPQSALLGTSKIAGITGSIFSARRFLQRVSIKGTTFLACVLPAFLCSFFGAWLAHYVAVEWLRWMLPWVMLCLLVYTLIKKDLGMQMRKQNTPWWRFVAVSGLIGTYDGLLGPGTGSLLLFAYVRIAGLDFLHASAYAKISNVASNASAIIFFASVGAIWWSLGLMLAVSNILGAWLGTFVVFRYGNRWLRPIFIATVTLLLFKSFAEIYLPHLSRSS